MPAARPASIFAAYLPYLRPEIRRGHWAADHPFNAKTCRQFHPALRQQPRLIGPCNRKGKKPIRKDVRLRSVCNGHAKMDTLHPQSSQESGQTLLQQG